MISCWERSPKEALYVRYYNTTHFMITAWHFMSIKILSISWDDDVNHHLLVATTMTVVVHGLIRPKLQSAFIGKKRFLEIYHRPLSSSDDSVLSSLSTTRACHQSHHHCMESYPSPDQLQCTSRSLSLLTKNTTVDAIQSKKPSHHNRILTRANDQLKWNQS